MRSALAELFALVRDLAAGSIAVSSAVPPWLLHRHNLGPLAALAGTRATSGDLAAATVRWLELEREVPPLVARFRDAGVGVAPIKGFAYARELYAVPAARPMSDVDLLVEPGREAVARTVLERAGFSRVGRVPLHHATMWERGRLTVDLHRNILPAGRGRVAIDEVWARTRLGWPEGARGIDPTDALVFHLVHMARDRLCGPLVQVVDIARLFQRAALPEALARAERWGISAPVTAALAYACSVLERAPAPWLAPADDDVLLARQPSRARKAVFDLATAGGVRQLAARVLGAGLQHAAITWYGRDRFR